MREDAATAQEVVSRARELLASSKSRMQRETLKVVIGIFDAHANKLAAGEPRNDCSIRTIRLADQDIIRKVTSQHRLR